MNIRREVERRRTFAIIAHPDAGKTTLTEKLLLYAGAVQLAGSVTDRKRQRATVSDWMELERKRGISVSSTVLQFNYGDYRINLLDTPGHRDFSEDTYRVLTAVDNAVMLIDAAKGVEAETRKLFEVCRQRGLPIFTFINKMDRPAREPLALLDELEKVLGIQVFPMNWPLGSGPAFKGVFDRITRQVHLFERTPGGAYRVPVEIADLHDPTIQERLDLETLEHIKGDLELLDELAPNLDAAAVLEGRVSPVFFGSAMNNFGVQLLWDGFLARSSPPTARQAGPLPVCPETPLFSGFIFKIQANMNPKHRDRVAFVRVVSGRFTRDMAAIHARTGRSVRLSNAQALLGRERETLQDAYPGDVIGIPGGRGFGIGDTFAEEPGIVFDEIPRFKPECFAYLRNANLSQSKQFSQGVAQLLQEGVVQAFTLPDSGQREVLLAAVGPLQFDVVRYRLESEYGVQGSIEGAPWEIVRWTTTDLAGGYDRVSMPTGAARAVDSDGQWALLFGSQWELKYFRGKNPDIELLELPPGVRRSPAATQQNRAVAAAG